MPYLMNISFDNTVRLHRDIWYFCYKGVKFKLVQVNSPEYADILLSILNDMDNKADEEQVYKTAGEFLSAVSWANHAKVKLGSVGGSGIPKGYSLRRARCIGFDFHQLPFMGNTIGGSISSIPFIQNEDQRTALVLFREAFSTVEKFLSFLLYWQVLEVEQTTPQAIKWIDHIFKSHRHKFRIDDYQMRLIDRGQKSLGECLREDFRNAIAHIRRSGGRRAIKLDTLEDSRRISAGVYAMEDFARFYIQHELKLDRKLHLVRPSDGFPIYVDDGYLRTKPWRPVYPNPSLKLGAAKKKPINRANFRRRRK